MTLDQQYLQLTKKICNHISIPPVVSVHLPNPINDVEKPDEFGFIFLQDGCVGPFYTSLEDSLQQLWQQIPADTSFLSRCRLFITGYPCQ